MSTDTTFLDENMSYNSPSDPTICPDHMILSLAYSLTIKSIAKFGPSSRNLVSPIDMVNIPNAKKGYDFLMEQNNIQCDNSSYYVNETLGNLQNLELLLRSKFQLLFVPNIPPAIYEELTNSEKDMVFNNFYLLFEILYKKMTNPSYEFPNKQMDAYVSSTAAKDHTIKNQSVFHKNTSECRKSDPKDITQDCMAVPNSEICTNTPFSRVTRESSNEILKTQTKELSPKIITIDDKMTIVSEGSDSDGSNNKDKVPSVPTENFGEKASLEGNPNMTPKKYAGQNQNLQELDQQSLKTIQEETKKKEETPKTKHTQDPTENKNEITQETGKKSQEPDKNSQTITRIIQHVRKPLPCQIPQKNILRVITHHADKSTQVSHVITYSNEPMEEAPIPPVATLKDVLLDVIKSSRKNTTIEKDEEHKQTQNIEYKEKRKLENDTPVDVKKLKTDCPEYDYKEPIAVLMSLKQSD